MRPIAAEKGIVKVVHPGKYVEILREPITAGEVMRKNPRHCLTRPDVFKFPWIVIKPDSVLPPGKVFFLVPHRTLYGLITAAERHRNRSPRREIRVGVGVGVGAASARPSSSSSPPKAFAGMTPKHRAGHNPSLMTGHGGEREEGPSPVTEATPYWLDRRNIYEEFRRLLEAEAESCDVAVDSDAVSEQKRCYDIGFVNGDHRASTSSRDYRDHQASSSRDYVNNYHDYRASLSRDYGNNYHDHRRDGNYGNVCEEALKSCLKKPESDRKSLGLRVSFASPLTSRDKETQSSSPENRRRNRFADFLNW